MLQGTISRYRDIRKQLVSAPYDGVHAVDASWDDRALTAQGCLHLSTINVRLSHLGFDQHCKDDIYWESDSTTKTRKYHVDGEDRQQRSPLRYSG